jgi:hypothetical protein
MADNLEKDLSRAEKLLKDTLTKAGKVTKDITNKAFRELIENIDEYSRSLDSISDSLEEQLDTYSKLKQQTKTLGENLNRNLKVVDKKTDLSQRLVGIYKDQNKLIEKLANNQEDLLTGELSSKQVNQDLLKTKSQSLNILLRQKDINDEITRQKSNLSGANEDEIKNINDKIIGLVKINEELELEQSNLTNISTNLKDQAKSAQEIETKVGIGGKLLSGFKKIPGLGDLLDMEGAETAMKATAAQGGSMFATLGAGAEALGSSLTAALGPIGLLIIAVEAIKAVAKFFVDAMFAADERVTKLAKGLMISKDGASAIYKSFTQSKFEIDSIYNTTKDVTEAFTDLTELTDFATTSTKEMVEAQIILTKNIGLSKEQAFGVQEAFAASNIEADKGVDVVYDQIAAFANQNKMVSTGKAIFNDIAKTSKLIQINFKGNLGSLVKTTLEAKKLGLTLDQVTKIGSSLLNFEESISSELEAELLTGRDLNLEKARLYALNHDIAGLTQEITKQGITQKSFTDMNVIQQEAIAKSLGMSAEEMGEMLYKASVLEKVGGQDLKNKRKIADELERQGNISESINLRNEIAQLEQGILSGKSLEEAEKSTSAQEKFNQALEQAKEIFSDLVTGGYLDKLSEVIKNFADTFSEGAAGVITGTGKDQAKEKRGAKSAEEFTSKLKGDEKTKYEAGLQEKLESEIDLQRLINLIAQPITTLTMSGEERIKRAQNQLTKEYYEESNNIQTPQVKFNAEMKAFNEQNKIGIGAPTEIPAKDFVIRTLPEDTVVGMGGTALGRTDEMVKLLTQQNQYLDKQNTLLASIYNKEGTIVLNGTKMGTGMNVGGYKTA